MPERNLVKTLPRVCGLLSVCAVMFLLSAQLGCSKINSSGLRNLVAPSGAAGVAQWEQDQSELERLVLNSEQANGHGENSFSPIQTDDGEECDSSSGCDCDGCHSSDRRTPKLPHAEPIAFPPSIPQSTRPEVIMNQAPPVGVLNQPLSPLLFDAKTRATNANKTRTLRDAVWQIENEAALNSKPELIETTIPFDSAPTIQRTSMTTEIVAKADRATNDMPVTVSRTVESLQTGSSRRLAEDSIAVVPQIVQPNPNVSFDEQPNSGSASLVEVETTPPFADHPDESEGLSYGSASNDHNLIEGENHFQPESNMELETVESQEIAAAPATPESFAEKNVAGDTSDRLNDFAAVATYTHTASLDQVELEKSTDECLDELLDEVEQSNESPECTQASPNDFEFAQRQPSSIEIANTESNVIHDQELMAATHVEPITSEVVQPSWQELIATQIDVAKTELSADDSPQRQQKEMNLRLLELLQRNMQAVESKEVSLNSNEQQYWQHQLDAIKGMLSTRGNLATELERLENGHDNAIATEPSAVESGLLHLRAAVERLEEMAGLRLLNAEFCTEIKGFGQTRPFELFEFQPEQTVLIYTEVENFRSVKTIGQNATSFVTRLQGEYSIVDANGKSIQSGEFPVTEDVANSKRRDFYMYFPVKFEQLPVGEYTLRLSVKDLVSTQTAELNPGLQFKVR